MVEPSATVRNGVPGVRAWRHGGQAGVRTRQFPPDWARLDRGRNIQPLRHPSQRLRHCAGRAAARYAWRSDSEARSQAFSSRHGPRQARPTDSPAARAQAAAPGGHRVSALRLTSQAVSKWERGENAPDIAVLLDLARLLGVSVEWILTGRQEAPGDVSRPSSCARSLNGFAERAARMAPADLAAWSNTVHYAVTEARPAVRRRAGQVRGRRVPRVLRRARARPTAR